jgi:NarL family two-component system sensor histidine kinase LiaS
MQRVNELYHFIRKSSSKMNLVFLYRYCSLLVTSFLYLLTSHSPLFFKIGVIALLVVAAWMITEVQRRYLANHNMLKLTVFAETIGLTLLLIPTGGISSPFIWYALTPVLIAARLFSRLTKELNIKETLLKAQQEELLQVKKALTETNENNKRTLEQIMSLYQLMENFSAEESLDAVAEEITSSLLKGTQSEAAFFWLTDLDHQTSYIANATKNSEIETELMKEWNNIRENREPFVGRINKESYRMIVIRGSNMIGVLGVEVPNSSETNETFLHNGPFEFLAVLSELWLERVHREQMKEQMLVIEERNRIANEIHDSVSQRLFGIVCALHSLQVKSRTMTWEQMNQEYQFLSQSANTTMKELRSAIYHLSSMKKGEKPFLDHLKKYLDEFAKLNDLSIDYQITGDEAEISDKLKQGLYRMICEACGNAVRHGECTHIELRLSLLDKKTVLVIRDNGIGIYLHDSEGKKDKGIGLINMKSIVNSFTGTFLIEGMHGRGTEIKIEIPNIIQKKQGVAG